MTGLQRKGASARVVGFGLESEHACRKPRFACDACHLEHVNAYVGAVCYLCEGVVRDRDDRARSAERLARCHEL